MLKDDFKYSILKETFATTFVVNKLRSSYEAQQNLTQTQKLFCVSPDSPVIVVEKCCNK